MKANKGEDMLLFIINVINIIGKNQVLFSHWNLYPKTGSVPDPQDP
jgi:hypothetical protein